MIVSRLFVTFSSGIARDTEHVLNAPRLNFANEH